jgi:hypothetical protein
MVWPVFAFSILSETTLPIFFSFKVDQPNDSVTKREAIKATNGSAI